MSNDAKARIERFVEVALFAPVGVALTLRDMAPTFVNMFVSRGRAEVDRRQQGIERHVKTVKSTGEVALAFGVPMVRDRIVGGIQRLRGGEADEPVDLAAAEGDRSDSDDPGAPVVTDPPLLRAVPTPSEPEAAGDAVPAAGNGSHADGVGETGVADLAIPGYDALAASQVVERLVGLDAAELAAVRDYEVGHRNRRTILGKIEQLGG